MEPGPSIRVYVAHPHGLVRHGALHAFRATPGFDVVGEAGDGARALEDIVRLAPDVAVLGEELVGLSAIGLLDALPPAARTRVVVLAMHQDDRGVYGALVAGAVGYLTTASNDPDELRAAVVAAASGELALCPVAQRALATEVQTQRRGTRPSLTRRERDVVRLAADGHRASEMARVLSIAVPTVKKHQQTAYEKLGSSTCAGAVAAALRMRLID